MTLQTNLGNFLTRCITAGLVVLFIAPFISLIQNEINSQQTILWKFKAGHFLWLVLLGLLFYLLMLIVSLFGVIKVEVENTLNSLTFSSLLQKRKISINDIADYLSTTHSNRFKKWNGVILNLKTGRSVQVVGQNVRSIDMLTNYLNENGVKCIGETKMKFPFN